MLILNKPRDVSKYIRVNNFHLSFYLQKQGYHPRYYDGDFYYYSKTEQIQKEIILYSILEGESEVSKFGKSL